jgi:hypothetical protein
MSGPKCKKGEGCYSTDLVSCIGGDLSVDFSRNWMHTSLLHGFCEDCELLPAINHKDCTVDYTCNFSMMRFNILDHFLLSNLLFQQCVDSVYVQHDVDNLSDHEPIFLRILLDMNVIGVRERVHQYNISWVKASEQDLSNYKSILRQTLSGVSLPVDSLLCHDLQCVDANHCDAIACTLCQ